MIDEAQPQDPALRAAWDQAIAACDLALQQGDLEAAEGWVLRALAAADAPAAEATARHRWAVLLERRGALEPALAEAETALHLDEVAYGPAHLAVARDLHTLGVIFARVGRADDGVAVLERSVSLSARLDAPEERAMSTLMLGSAYRAAGRPDDALRAFAEAAEQAEQLDGPHSLRVLRALGGMAEAARAVGQLPRAHRAWVEVTRRLAGLPVEAPLVIRAELGLAWLGLGLLAEEGRREREDARAMFSFALELFSPAEHPAAALAAERVEALGGPLAPRLLPRDPAEPPLVVYWSAAARMGDLAHPRGGRWTVEEARAGGPLQPGTRPPWDVLEGPLSPG